MIKKQVEVVACHLSGVQIVKGGDSSEDTPYRTVPLNVQCCRKELCR